MACTCTCNMHLTCTVQHIRALCKMHITHHIVYIRTSSAVNVRLHTVQTVHSMHNVHVHCQQRTLYSTTDLWRNTYKYIYRMEIYNKEKLSIQFHAHHSTFILSQKGQTGLCPPMTCPALQQHCPSALPLQSAKRDS